METTGDPQTPAAMTPPTEPGDAPERRSRWPTVIGIIAVVFGALGVFDECLDQVSNMFFASLGDSTQGMSEEDKAEFEAMRQYAVPTVIMTVVGTVLSAWLLVAGIGVLRRRPWSRGAAVGWAVAKILYTIPLSVLGYFIIKAQFEAMEPIWAAVWGCSTLWAWALPLFLIIWFRRAPVKTEVERWALESRAKV